MDTVSAERQLLTNARHLLIRAGQRLAGQVDSIVAELADKLPPGNFSSPADEDHIPDASDSIRTVVLMIQALGVSLRSMSDLGVNDKNEMSVRDCFGIARSICELAVNCCLILSNPDYAKRAHQHAMTRLYRDSAREISLAGVKITLRRQPETQVDEWPALQNAIAQFTRRSGAEVRDWSDSSIDSRIEEVAKYSASAGRSLASARFLIYRHSSEVLHGSYYGVLYFWSGDAIGAPSRKKVLRAMASHVLSCLTTAYLSVCALTEALNAAGIIPKNSINLGEFETLLLKIVDDQISVDSPDPE